MCAVTVTNLTLVRDTLKDRVLDAATSSVIDEVEVFTITPTKSQDKMIIEIEVANSHGAVSVSLGAGAQFWPSAALAWDCPENKTTIMHVSDIGRFMVHVADIAGTHYPDTILLTLTPYSGKRLLTDHAAKVGVIELP